MEIEMESKHKEGMNAFDRKIVLSLIKKKKIIGDKHSREMCKKYFQ